MIENIIKVIPRFIGIVITVIVYSIVWSVAFWISMFYFNVYRAWKKGFEEGKWF